MAERLNQIKRHFVSLTN